MTGYSVALFGQHAALLAGSGISPERARARGYVSIDTKKRLADLGITRAGQSIPGLLIPELRTDGSTWGWQYRPDHPRSNGDGKPIKYETPVGQRNGVDVPPGVGPMLSDPAETLVVTEGVRKADAAAERGLACVALPGVWSWRGTNKQGGKTAVADWHDVALNSRRVVLAFDSDVSTKPAVRGALDGLAGYLASKGARVEYAHLPNDGDGKCGLDDYLAGHDVEELWRLVRPDPPIVGDLPLSAPEPPAAPCSRNAVKPISLAECHQVFTRWFGADYDTDVLDIVLAAAAAEQLPGDPPWLLIVSGSGAAKTETVSALAGAHALVTSTITSEGALLSATSTKERAKDSTGGLLRKIGDRGVLVIKDMTSILSMDRVARGHVLAALREVYDGKWERNVGVDGGRSLDWTGRIIVIGAVTTAWDSAHTVVSAMGDRFLLARLDSTSGRSEAGRQAIRNSSVEAQMRTELADAAAGLIAGIDTAADLALTDAEVDLLLGLADVVTLTRTAVERDYRGDVVDAHAPEMPTRFAKQLTMIVRGALAIGVDRPAAFNLAVRCARDSMPPLRLAVLLDVHANPDTTTHAARVRLKRPRVTVDRTIQALHVLGLVDVDEVEEPHGIGTRSVWRYMVSDLVNRGALTLMGSSRNVVSRHLDTEKRAEKEDEGEGARLSTHISGTTPATDVPLDLHSCPRCGVPTNPSANGHPSYCGICTDDDERERKQRKGRTA